MRSRRAYTHGPASFFWQCSLRLWGGPGDSAVWGWLQVPQTILDDIPPLPVPKGSALLFSHRTVVLPTGDRHFNVVAGSVPSSGMSRGFQKVMCSTNKVAVRGSTIVDVHSVESVLPVTPSHEVLPQIMLFLLVCPLCNRRVRRFPT